MFVNRTHGLAVATLALGLGACTDPAQNTDLRPEGPPDVLAVMVLTDASSQLVESATFCRPNDNKRPSLVGLPDFTTQQVCPADGTAVTDAVTTAYPDGWYVRIMFDELLDPSIETLTEVIDDDTGEPTGTFTGSIAGSHPVTLQCESVNGGMVNVDYDGYYSPSGNRVTWPLGPSLVIKPNSPKLIATNTACQITINDNVLDKGGTPVEMAQRGPYKFKVAPIKVISIDPADDPEFDDPIDAVQIYFDNPFVQFNTNVTLDTLCPDTAGGGDGLCDDEKVFSITDVAHPTQGPGYCNSTGEPCGQVSDCPTGNTVCGRGFCTATPDSCNKASDCPTANDSCGTNYAYDYLSLGSTETEFGIGPPEPIETEHKYTMQFTAGAKLKDRCGRESTLPEPTVDNLMLVHFATNKFAPKTTFTSIVNGETASAMKRLQFNFTNVLEGQDTATGASRGVLNSTAMSGTSGAFTISPLPKKLTAACPGGGAACTTADLTTAELLIVAPDASGQTMLQGHLQLNTEYTATLKAGTVIKDFYGKEYTQPTDLVIKWKTQPAIQMTGISVRYTGQLFSIVDKGTLVKPTPATTVDVRLAFNASMDPTTLDVADVKIEPAVPGIALASASGCGNFSAAAPPAFSSNATGWQGTCSLRLRGAFQPGEYKITLVKGAQFKDIFGVAYTQAEDQSITVKVEEAPAPTQCL